MIHVSQDMISSVTDPITGELAHIHRFTLVNDATNMYVQVSAYWHISEVLRLGSLLLSINVCMFRTHERTRATCWFATLRLSDFAWKITLAKW